MTHPDDCSYLESSCCLGCGQQFLHYFEQECRCLDCEFGPIVMHLKEMVLEETGL